MPSSTMKNYVKSPDQRENDKYPEISPLDTEICNLNDREFKIAIIKKFNKFWSYFTKEIEIMKQS